MKPVNWLFRSIARNLQTNYLVACTLFMFLNCSSRIIQNEQVGIDARTLAAAAQQKFSESPRTVKSAGAAYDLIKEATQKISKDNPKRFDYLIQSAKYAIWLSYHGEGKNHKSKFANAAIKHSHQAIAANSQRVEGYYYRAIASGLFAEQNRLFGKAAMHQIRKDLLTAIDLDPSFDYGGPHRVLGAVYLRAPGPPAGIGSIRRAVFHLKEAYKISDEYPENLLFLAEAYLKLKKIDEATQLLTLLKSHYLNFGEPSDQDDWLQRTVKLKSRLEHSN